MKVGDPIWRFPHTVRDLPRAAVVAHFPEHWWRPQEDRSSLSRRACGLQLLRKGDRVLYRGWRGDVGAGEVVGFVHYERTSRIYYVQGHIVLDDAPSAAWGMEYGDAVRVLRDHSADTNGVDFAVFGARGRAHFSARGRRECNDGDAVVPLEVEAALAAYDLVPAVDAHEAAFAVIDAANARWRARMR